MNAMEILLRKSTKNYTPLEAAVVFMSERHPGDANNAAAELAQKDEALAACLRADTHRQAAQHTVTAYAAAARVIALWTDKYCNKDLPYDEMIAQAVRDMAKDLEAKDEALRLARDEYISIIGVCDSCIKESLATEEDERIRGLDPTQRAEHRHAYETIKTIFSSRLAALATPATTACLRATHRQAGAGATP